MLALGLLGATLLYGDGMITPAISVLGAIQGLDVMTPALSRYVVPATILVLIFLFSIQRRGTGDISKWFGPIMALWFAALALSGLVEIIRHPFILVALNPWIGLRFLMERRLMGFLVLGAVILAVTGAEALYADLGHFGRTPIRMAWFALVFPGLILNYLGQGALLLHDPQAISAPLYQLVPHWALIPTVLLATAATIIASQSIISGSFSLMGQSIRLNQTPRMKIIQTSHEQKGRIYIPTLNWLLMLGTIGLVLAFQTSNTSLVPMESQSVH
ncbi:potassium transporter [mine drainage metagenome]|uniref:Potassium transporter n=1 Tax=mine drainage metagenome TaxID=410659 RepID=T1B7T9_9ZZZZ